MDDHVASTSTTAAATASMTHILSTASSDTSGYSSVSSRNGGASTASTADTSTNDTDDNDAASSSSSSRASTSGSSSSKSKRTPLVTATNTDKVDTPTAVPDKVDVKGKGKGKEKEEDKEKSVKEKEKDKIEVLAERAGYRKELRTSSKGRKYLIETKGLWTTLRSLTPLMNNRSRKERLVKRLSEFATVWPFLLKFAREVINLGKWRFLLHLVASTITGLTPALRIYLSGRLIAIAQDASDRKAIDKAELLLVAGSSYLSSFVESWIDSLLANNNGILQRRFQAMVSEHLISARARLDVHTLGKSRVMRDFSSASSLVHALGDGTFVIGQLIDLFTTAVSLATQSSMLWRMTSKDTADLAMISVFSSSLTLLRWAWRRRGSYTVTSITDSNYNRMNLMEELSYPELSTFGERKVLGLGDWVYEQYKKASNALGDVSLAEPWSTDPFTSATEALRSFSDTAIIVLFALKVSEKPIGEATLSMSSLTFIQSATRNLTSSLLRFIYDVQHFGDELSAYKSYYRVLEIKSAIKEPEEPFKYETFRRTIPPKEDAKEDAEPIVRAGMEVEFKNVCYTWPGRKEKALDGISFKINAGELTAVVGYNGAGKSTIIALIARLCDPTSGEILINGHDIRSYRTTDLHKAMSFLFQSSADLPLTIQEYIGVGNLAEIQNLEKIRKAATDSGAAEFIDKLEEGFQSSFTGHVTTETPDTMYKDAVAWDAYLDESDNEDSDDDSDSNSDSGSESDAESESDEKTDGATGNKARSKEMGDKKGSASENDEKKKKKSSAKSKNGKTVDEAEEEKTGKGKRMDKKKEAGQEDDESEGEDGSGSDSSHSDSGSDSSDASDASESEGRLAFSGGQRQKLILARSFLRDNCDLAIFDEYSANLDPLAEHELFTRITANRGKQTLLYITHRYSTVRHADRILMLEKGKVIESGTHEELMAIPNGKYAEMSKLALGEIDVDKKKKKDGDSADEKTSESLAADQAEAAGIALPPSRPHSPANA